MKLGLALAMCGLLAACRTDAPPRSVDRSRPEPAQPGVSAPKTPPVWIVSAASLRRHRALAPRADAIPEGAIISGLRVSHPESRIADDIATPALVGGARVPPHLGGGHLFWSSSAVYRARTLLGRLEPLTATPAPVQSVSFGPKLALLRFSDGSRQAIELPGGRALPMPLVGLIDIASAGPNAHLAVVEPGRLFLASERGAFQERPAISVESILPGDGEVWVQDEAGQAFRLGADGSFAGFDRLPAKTLRANQLAADPRWPLTDETPLERAVRRGVPVGDRALVEAGGALAWVSLTTGELAEIGPRILPDRSTCRLFPFEKDVIATCTTQRGSAFVASGLAGAEPRVEKSFPTAGVFFNAGFGTLLFAAACASAPSEAGSLCLRGADGNWRSLEQPMSDAEAKTPAHSVSRWIPKRDGSVLGVVEAPKRGLLELPSGTFTPFTEKDQERLHRLTRPAPNDALVDDATLLETGEIALVLEDGSARVRRDGSVERPPHTLSQVVQAGHFAIGRDSSGKLWQTIDWGRSWLAVAGPPSPSPQSTPFPRRCSYAGCDFDSWYRIGYPIQPDLAQRFVTAPPAPRRARASVPRLACSPTAPAQISTAPNPHGLDASDPHLDLGARRLPVRGEGSRAAFMLADGLPRVALIGSAVRLVEAFAIAPTVRSGRPPTHLVLPNVNDGAAVPVLAESGPDGWLALLEGNNQLAIWMRADRPARVAAMAETFAVPNSSVQLRGEELWVPIGQGGNCAERVLSLGPRGSTPLFDLPHRPTSGDCPVSDVIGVDRAGKLALLRFPSGSAPPSADDPALAIARTAKPLALAPWASLSTTCDGHRDDELRALVVAPPEWLELELTGSDDELEDARVLALVRWSPSRLCLDAVEISAAGEIALPDRALQTAVVARFGAKPEAGRRGVDFGAEYREPLECALEAP